MKAYLCGAMSSFYETNEYNKAVQWRKTAKQRLEDSDIDAFDPTVGSQQAFKMGVSFNNGVIYQNYAYLKDCDFLLVNLDRIEDSIGSLWEISTAWLLHKPVIAFRVCSKWTNRPHWQSLITIQMNTLDDAIYYIQTMYSQK